MFREIIQGWKNLLFGKEEPLFLPSERAVVDWNPYMVEKGFIDDEAKEIHLFKHGVKRTFPYSRRFLSHLHLKGDIPIYDNTEKGVAPEILATVNVGDYEYT